MLTSVTLLGYLSFSWLINEKKIFWAPELSKTKELTKLHPLKRERKTVTVDLTLRKHSYIKNEKSLHIHHMRDGHAQSSSL